MTAITTVLLGTQKQGFHGAPGESSSGAHSSALRPPLLVCCRWSSRRVPLTSGPSFLPSSTCYHSASPQHPCSAASGLWAHRRCPSPCAGKVWQPSALTCRCPWMGASPTHQPRRWYNTPGRLGMTASPSLPSAVACGYPVRKPWKSQVIPSHQLQGLICFLHCIFLVSCMGRGLHMCVEVRGQCARIHSPPPARGARGSNSSSQVWQAGIEPSRLPSKRKMLILRHYLTW